MTKKDLEGLVVKALRSFGGRASVVEVSRYIWENHQRDLEDSASLLYTWQYDVRWAAHRLRRKGLMRSAQESPDGIWELAA